MPRATPTLAVLAALATSACAKDDACSCDLIDVESTCIGFSATANPLYRLQLEATCDTSLQSICDVVPGGTYTMDLACPSEDVVAECTIDVVTYAQTKYYYATGAEPYAATDPDFEEDCSGGTVTTY